MFSRQQHLNMLSSVDINIKTVSSSVDSNIKPIVYLSNITIMLSSVDSNIKTKLSSVDSSSRQTLKQCYLQQIVIFLKNKNKTVKLFKGPCDYKNLLYDGIFQQIGTKQTYGLIYCIILLHMSVTIQDCSNISILLVKIHNKYFDKTNKSARTIFHTNSVCGKGTIFILV